MCVGFAVLLIGFGGSSISMASLSSTDVEFMWGIHAYHVPFDSYKLNERDLEIIASNGIGWVSIEFAWRDMERVKGIYEFSYFDMVVEAAQRNRLKIVGGLGNGYNGVRSCVPDWTLELGEEEYVEALSKYIEKVVERYGGTVDYWKVENEPNVVNAHLLSRWRVGKWSDERIFKILEESYKVIREFDPGSKIILSISSSAPGWVDWLERVSVLDFDIIGLQSYPCLFLDSPENAASTAYEIRVAQNHRNDVIVLETGYHNFHRTQEQQAQYIEEMVEAVLRAGGKGVLFYEYIDSPDEYPEQEKHFGLLENDRTPKKAWYRYGEVVEKYKGRENEFVQETELGTMDKLVFDLVNTPVVYNLYNWFMDLMIKIPAFQRIYLFLVDDMAALTYEILSIVSRIIS